MKGIVFHTRSFSVHDGPGIRKAIFLKGCPLRCVWCHNPESHRFEVEEMQANQKLGDKSFNQAQFVGEETTVDALMQSIRKDVPFFEESGGGVTLTGGEPLSQPDFAISLLKACSDEGIHTALDTCGYASPKAVEQSLSYTNLYLFDLKLANANEHRKYTGVDNGLILQNLTLISKAGKPVTIRIPLVEGITDTAENLDGLRAIIAAHGSIQRIDLLRYHTLAKHKFAKINTDYALSDMVNYPTQKAEQIARTFAGLAPSISVGG